MNVAQDIFVRPPPLCVPKLLVRAHEAIDELMSAIGPKQTSLVALHMSAFGGKADIDPSIA